MPTPRCVALSEFKYKQVILIRTDLGMSKGKIASQAAHAAVSALEEAKKMREDWVREWLDEGQRKVVLKVSSEEELRKYYEEAKQRGLPAYLVVDRGLTEIPPNTPTSVGIGPAPSEKIDEITGKLPLL